MDPAACVRAALAARPDLDPFDPQTLLLAIGKAGAGMARGALARSPHGEPEMPPRGAPQEPGRTSGQARGAAPALAHGEMRSVARGFVLVPEAAAAAGLPAGIEVLRGGHPWPTAEGLRSTARLVEAVAAQPRGGVLLILLSGGASALLEMPAPGLDLDDLLATHRALVLSGAPIRDINRVRTCLSAVKGGGLVAGSAARRIATLAISDVEGDDPATIGSGPTVTVVPDPRGALAILDGGKGRAAIDVPPRVRRFLEEAAGASAGADAAEVSTALLPQNDIKTNKLAMKSKVEDYIVVGSVAHARAAAGRALADRGYVVMDQRAYLRGSTREAAARLADDLEAGTPGASPLALVAGGETTVDVTAPHPGRGGRNLDLAARLAMTWQGRSDVVAVVGGSDGVDGTSRAAGAVVDGGTAARARAAGRPLEAALAAFDTEPALDAAGDLFVTGPTGTNVGDLVVMLRRPAVDRG